MSDVGRILDKAAGGSREQLYAALQAAIGQLVDACHGGDPRVSLDQACAEIERRFDMGVTYGTEFLSQRQV